MNGGSNFLFNVLPLLLRWRRGVLNCESRIGSYVARLHPFVDIHCEGLLRFVAPVFVDVTGVFDREVPIFGELFAKAAISLVPVFNSNVSFDLSRVIISCFSAASLV